MNRLPAIASAFVVMHISWGRILLGVVRPPRGQVRRKFARTLFRLVRFLVCVWLKQPLTEGERLRERSDNSACEVDG